jgi:hypothetical protein
MPGARVICFQNPLPFVAMHVCTYINSRTISKKEEEIDEQTAS